MTSAPPARCALFAWGPHEAQGGVHDWQLTGTLDECKSAFSDYVEIHDGDAIGEIVDMADLRIIVTADVVAAGPPSSDGAWSWIITWQ